jgi:NAD(P)-dependent dehydrogenase (short-subunit alcohol dehydrogenase family)
MPQKIALVTGGNQGIGLALVKILAQQDETVVWMGVRDIHAGEAAAKEINNNRVKVLQLDVTSSKDIALAKERIFAEEKRGIDILVNNAGVLLAGNVLNGREEDVWLSLNINIMGAYHLIRSFVPDMIAQNYGRIVNVSSGWGSFAEGLGGPFAYSMSKAALNALTVMLSYELPSNVKVNAVSPGWVQTRMTNYNGTRVPLEAAESILWLTQLPEDGPSGKFFRNKQEIPW